MSNILYQKMKSEIEFEENRKLTDAQNQELFKKASSMIKKVNINQVRLEYTAFMFNEMTNTWVKICEPVVSAVINNKKSGKVGDLKICKMSVCASEVGGDQEIFMFVSKVDKSELQVRLLIIFIILYA